MKEVKFVKKRTVVIITLLVVIFFMYAVLSYVEKNYQKEYEEIPELSVYYKGNKIAEFLPLTYKWSYKGETKEVPQFKPEVKKQGEFTMTNPYKQYGEYDFAKENTIFISSKMNNDYVMKMNERHKMTKNSYTLSAVTDLDDFRGSNSYSGSREFDDSKVFLKGMPLNENYNLYIGEYVYIETIDFLKQGTVDYCVKVIVYDEDDARIAKDYLNTDIADTNKIEELAKKIKYNTLLNSVKIENKNLILEYDWHIKNDNLKMNNLIWFACIPGLETITYAPTNKKTMRFDQEGSEQKKQEVENVVYTREEVDSESLANIENLKKFMEQI